jgi:DNA-binding response OmpR family regulator
MVAGHRHRRVTVVDDSPELLALLGDALRFEGVEASLLDGTTTLQSIEESDPDVLMIDLRLGSANLGGLDLIRLVRRHEAMQDIPIIVCSAAQEELREHGEELTELRDLLILRKPFSLGDLESTVDAALGRPAGTLAAD